MPGNQESDMEIHSLINMSRNCYKNFAVIAMFRMEWDQPHAVAFTAFADMWPRATETEIGAALLVWEGH